VQKQHRIFKFDWENIIYLLKINSPIKLYKTAVIAYAKQFLPEF
jgi:hypothetical protein